MMALKRENRIRHSVGDKVFLGGVYLFLGIFVFTILYPLIYVVSCSFSSPMALISGRVFFLPVDPGLQGYEAVFRNEKVWNGYWNTIVYTLVGTLIGTAVTMVGAFVLSRREFPMRRGLTTFFMVTMFFNGGTVPTYLLIQKLHMLNSIWALVLPGAFSVWLAIVGKTFIQSSIPEALFEAASLDGSDYFQYLRTVILPLSKPILAVLALNFAISHWNSYYNALLYMSRTNKYPLQLVLREILLQNTVSLERIGDVQDAASRQYLSELLKYSLIVVSSAPLICVYPFIQKYFIKGVMIGSVKG